jgi:hypothetical protein
MDVHLDGSIISTAYRFHPRQTPEDCHPGPSEGQFADDFAEHRIDDRENEDLGSYSDYVQQDDDDYDDSDDEIFGGYHL